MSNQCHCDIAGTNGYLLGIACGLEEASKVTIGMATQLFACSLDEQAKLFRAISSDLMKLATEARARKDKHVIDYPILESEHLTN